MAVDIHKKIRAYLRENGKSNMSGYHLDWENGRTSIVRWEYQDVPEPTNAALATVAPRYLAYETDTAHTNDIYYGEVQEQNAPTGFNWATCALTEARPPNISELTTNNSVKISSGYWKLLVSGWSRSVIILQIIMGENHRIYQRMFPECSFDMTRIVHAENETEIRLNAQRVNTRDSFALEYTVVLERI